MFIIGFVTVVTIPLILIYYSFIQDSNQEIGSTQTLQIARKIVDAAESVYYLGEPSQTTLRVNIPDSVVLANISAGYELVYKIKTTSGESDIVQSSSVNITGSLPTSKGTYLITVQAKSDHVEVSYK